MLLRFQILFQFYFAFSLIYFQLVILVLQDVTFLFSLFFNYNIVIYFILFKLYFSYQKIMVTQFWLQ